MIIQEIIVFVLGCCGGVVRGFTGGGHGMIVIILWSIGNVVGVPSLPHLKQLIACHVFSGIPGGICFMIFSEACVYGQFGIAIIMIIFSNVGAMPGAYLVKLLNERVLMIVLAAVLLLIVTSQVSVAFILQQIQKAKQKKQNNYNNNISDNKNDITTQNDMNNNGDDDNKNSRTNDSSSSNNNLDSYDEEKTVKNDRKISVDNNNQYNDKNSTDKNTLQIRNDINNDNGQKYNVYIKCKQIFTNTYQTVQYLVKIFWYIIRCNAKYQKVLTNEKVRLIFEFKDLQSQENNYVKNEIDEPLIHKSSPKKSSFVDYLEVTASKGYIWGLKYMISLCTLAGFMYAMVGLPGPAYMIMQQIIRMPKLECIATFAISSSFNLTILDYVVSGQFRLQDIYLYVCYTVGFISGIYLGSIGNRKISEKWFQRSLKIVIFVAAIFLLCQGLKIIPSSTT